MKVLVVLPTYCERQSLPLTMARLRAAAPEADALVVDDGSPDGTGEVADRLAAADTQVHVLHRTGRRGLGAAYVTGFTWGLERDYDVLVEMDADGSHQPEELVRLLDALAAGADLALGSRWVPGGQVLNWAAGRQALSRGGNVFTRRALGVPVHDATGGFRAFTRKVLEAIPLDDVASQGYCFQVDLLWRAVQLGFRVVEVPITFVERELGSSKMSRAIVVEALWRVSVWGTGHRLSQARTAVAATVGDAAARREETRWHM